MKILITGAAGFIGSNFLHYWIKKHPKDKVVVIDALTFAGNIENIKPVLNKIEFIEADITDRDKVRSAMKGVDAVVHFAAESHVDRSIFMPDLFWKTNVDGTLILLEEAEKAGVTRFHHISTDEVYGELPLNSEEKFSEETPYAPRPDNLYAISKAEADHIVMEYCKNSKMHITISNCSNNYGPYQFPEKYVPILITNLIDKMKAPVHGDGLNVRDWIHTLDHSTAIEIILEKGRHKETYLVGSENDRYNKEIAQKIVTLYGKDPKKWIKYVPDRHSNDRRYAIDARKITNELGWKPVFNRDNFDDGLKETIDWYKKNEDWWRPLLKRKAVISDGDHNIVASFTLDREVGKMKYNYEHSDEGVEVKETAIDEEDLSSTRMFQRNSRGKQFAVDKLLSRQWFKDSDTKIKDELMLLVDDPRTRGFVEDIANRPDKLGSAEVQKLIKIEHAPREYGIYGIAAWFKVKYKENGEKVEGVYSWAWGPKSGAKLLILLKEDELISYLIVLENEKFPIGAVVYDLPGGFPEPNESVLDLVKRQIKKEVGVKVGKDEPRIEDVVGLGRVMPDSGMTNNHPLLYAVVLKGKKKDFNKKNGNVVLWPISKLSELVNTSDDAYLLSALTRLTLSGITNLKLG